MSNKNSSNNGNNSPMRNNGYSPATGGRVEKGYRPSASAKPASPPPPPPSSGSNVSKPAKSNK